MSKGSIWIQDSPTSITNLNLTNLRYGHTFDVEEQILGGTTKDEYCVLDATNLAK